MKYKGNAMNKVHISKMTGKLQGLQAISTNTVTNKFCNKQNASKNNEVICKHCYSHSMLNTYRKNMQDCLQRNSDTLSLADLEDVDIPRINQLYMRFNAHGELINETHLKNLIKICVKNPNVFFTLWSKRKDIIIKYFDKIGMRPRNLKLVFSNSIINTIIDPPKYFDSTFNNVDQDYMKEKQNCTGQKCIDCLLCYTHNDTKHIVEAVKINGRAINR